MKIKQENIYKYFLGVVLSLMLIVLSTIATLQYQSSLRFERFAIENSQDHNKMDKTINKEISYTHSIHKYEIQPVIKKCGELRGELTLLKIDVVNNYDMIKRIELKMK